jgi:hypothetical protein
VSHHPPVSALHATDEKENVELIWCQQPVPKFYGRTTFPNCFSLLLGNMDFGFLNDLATWFYFSLIVKAQE